MDNTNELRRNFDDILSKVRFLNSYRKTLKACGVVRRPTSYPGRKHNSKALYFILCGDAIKIGVSVDPESRLGALQTGAPGRLQLLAAFPEKGAREDECHKKMAHLHLTGEWFRYTEDVDRLIEDLRDEK